MANSKSTKFKAGDVVQLISGGPAMSVTGIFHGFPTEDDGQIVCQWFTGGKLNKGHFPETILVAYVKPDAKK